MEEVLIGVGVKKEDLGKDVFKDVETFIATVNPATKKGQLDEAYKRHITGSIPPNTKDKVIQALLDYALGK